MNAILRNHIEQLERSYMEALSRALDRLEERQRKRAELIRKALENLDIEAEKERIKKVMSEIREKNGRTRP